MKDNKKQIEEIAKEMCGGCYEGKECMHGLCADWYKAEKLYDKGYRKIGKDSVVLTADEFASLKKYAYEKGRKETAKEFYEFANAWFEDDEQNDYFEEVKNLAKQIGVEIKES